jgi:hypothetical protein
MTQLGAKSKLSETLTLLSLVQVFFILLSFSDNNTVGILIVETKNCFFDPLLEHHVSIDSEKAA